MLTFKEFLFEKYRSPPQYDWRGKPESTNVQDYRVPRPNTIEPIQPAGTGDNGLGSRWSMSPANPEYMPSGYAGSDAPKPAIDRAAKESGKTPKDHAKDHSPKKKDLRVKNP